MRTDGWTRTPIYTFTLCTERITICQSDINNASFLQMDKQTNLGLMFSNTFSSYNCLVLSQLSFLAVMEVK
jgi:hypothetical protein